MSAADTSVEFIILRFLPFRRGLGQEPLLPREGRGLDKGSAVFTFAPLLAGSGQKPFQITKYRRLRAKATQKRGRSQISCGTYATVKINFQYLSRC